jgi:hypothetical protein
MDESHFFLIQSSLFGGPADGDSEVEGHLIRDVGPVG